MKFKVNDKVKMLTTTRYWNKGDIGRIVRIDSYFGPESAPYLICFEANCKDAASCDYSNTWWANESSIERAYPLMKVD
jgi:hypothetical protein